MVTQKVLEASQQHHWYQRTYQESIFISVVLLLEACLMPWSWLRSSTASFTSGGTSNLSESILEPRAKTKGGEQTISSCNAIVFNHIKRKGPTKPKSMLRAIGQLKKRRHRNNTTGKGSGVVILGKTEYVSLLKESSISNETKFIPISLERPKTKGRPPKRYHPLLKKEKELSSIS